MTTNDKDCRPEFEAWRASCGKSPLMWNTSDAMFAAWAAAAREQREALARVEAERDSARITIDLWKEQYDSAVRCGNELLAERYTAQAQLAEAVGLLNWLKTELDDFPSLIRVIDKVLARHAQAEQQEARGAQAGDERSTAEQAYVEDAFDYSAAPIGSRDWTLYWKGWQARAALATQPAAGEPVATRLVLPTPEQVMHVVMKFQWEDRKNGTGTTNWAANLGMAVVEYVARLNPAPPAAVREVK